jgi:hypothetical protein
MTRFEDVQRELAESTRTDGGIAEQAVDAYFAALALPTPRMHWADSIAAAIRLSEAWRPQAGFLAERIYGRGAVASVQLVRVLESDEDPHRLWPQSDARARVVPPLTAMAHVELHEARARVEEELYDAGTYYRRKLHEARPGDEWRDVLYQGVVPFHMGQGFSFFSIRQVVNLEAAARERGSIPEGSSAFLKALFSMARDVYWMYLTDDDVVLVPPPLECRCDADGRPHCEDGPVAVTRDGHELFAVRGVCLPRCAVVDPLNQDIRDIEIEPDWHSRALMIERYGLERYLRDSGAMLWVRDDCGELYFKAQHNQEPLVAVRVRNSTPEPDGSHRHYFLRVPPYITTPHEAVAWTFSMDKNEYQPNVET